MKDKISRVRTISELHRIAGGPPPVHPLISIIRIEDLPDLPHSFPESMIFEFYSVGIKKNLKGYIKYGRTKYDFQEGVMGFTSPNQVLSFANLVTDQATGWLLYFHPELLAGNQLAKKIQDYGFFRYAVHEALHLSIREEKSLDHIFENMLFEYEQRLDQFSKNVMLSNLELLLTYANRYYNRQFLIRHEVDSSFVDQFQGELKVYFDSDLLISQGIPGVDYFADKLNISSSYLSDLLKSITGKTTKEHIHFKLIERAKEYLLASDQSVAEIAYDLGFEYPQYFNRLFKHKTGMTPKEYRVKQP